MRLGQPHHHFAVTDSTNAHLKRLAGEGAPVGTVVSADAQTAGYGQRGRTWVSAPGRGLYVSMLLPFPATPFHLPFVLGLGCRDALAAYTDEVGLKWVNDLVARRRKLGGMLVELTKAGAIAGIGINLAAQDVTDDSARAAVADAIALADLTPAVPAPEDLLARLLSGIEHRHAQWQADGFEPIRADWMAASVTLGRSIQVIGEAEPLAGVAEAIGPSGELLLRRPDGALETVISGTIRTADGAYC
jgi:BirA family biotin operon repressor/biotin-[acetyl-CoA-carboxylase] ligase